MPDIPNQSPKPDYPEQVPVKRTITQEIEKVTQDTKTQWLALGGLFAGVAGFVLWCLVTLTSYSTAQAQTKVTAESTAAELADHKKKDAEEKLVIFKMFEEQRQDSKDLYKAVMERKASKRLAGDAGTDD